LTNKNFTNAVKLYTQAIQLEPLGIYYRDRSKAYLGLKKYDKALEDANKAIELDPDGSEHYITRAMLLMK